METKTAHQLQRELNLFVQELDNICTDERAREYYDESYINEQIDRWRGRMTDWLKQNLGAEFGAEFMAKRPGGWGDPQGTIDDRNDVWRNYLLSLEADIAEHPGVYLAKHAVARAEQQPMQTLPPAQVILEQVLSRFHAAVLQLRQRHDARNTLDVQDEHDVQDLLHVLLRAHFEDIRPEEVSPSYGGSGSRIDFILPEHRIAVEAKVATPRLKDKKIGEQLLIDIARYKKHPDCDKLVCFIYDPAHNLSNPRGLVRDLSRRHDGLAVTVVVSPAA